MLKSAISSACISVHKRGYIYARVLYYDSTGRRREYRERTHTKTDAKEAIRKFTAKLQKSGTIAFEGRRRTFAAVAKEYEQSELVEAVIINGTKVSGRKEIYWPKKMVATLIEYFGADPIQAITRPDIEDFRRERFTTPKKYGGQRSIRSVNYELQTLRAIFYFADAKGWLERPPAKLFAKLISSADETRRNRLLTPDEQTRLLAACTGYRLHIRPVVIAALDTSLRRGRLLALRWRDIDLESKIITTTNTKRKTEQQLVIAMTPRLEAELRELWRLCDKNPDTLVFGIPGEFKKAWQTALEKAGIRNLHFHDLRGQAVTEMVLAGVPAEIVRKLTGHSNPAILRDHYIRADIAVARRTAEAVERYRNEAKQQKDYIN